MPSSFYTVSFYPLLQKDAAVHYVAYLLLTHTSQKLCELAALGQQHQLMDGNSLYWQRWTTKCDLRLDCGTV